MMEMQNYCNDLQIVFVSTTQYTFLITDIYARYIFDNYGVKPIVFYRKVRNFDISKYKTDEKYTIYPYSVKNHNVFGQCIFALQCGYLFRLSEWFKAVEKNKKTILFAFNDKNKLVSRLFSEIKKNNTKNKIVLIEEGTDTYSESLDISNKGLYHFKHTLSRLLFGIGRSSEVIGANTLIDYAIVKDVKKYKALSKAKTQTVLQQDPDILRSSADFIEHYGDAASGFHECDVMYIGSPYYKNGKRFEYENELISIIFKSLPENMRIVIKPHPRETTGKYRDIVRRFKNVTIISEELAPLPVETLLSILKTKTIVTIQSSAAVTVANMFPNIYSFVLRRTPEGKKLDAKLREAGQELPQIGDEYFIGNNNNIFLPNSIDEYARQTREAVKQDSMGAQIPRYEKDHLEEIDCLLSANMVEEHEKN